VEGSAEHEAAEHAATADGHDEDEERLPGVDVESPRAVTAAVVVSLALAVGLWLRQRRWLATGVVAVVFAVFDIAEVAHQARASGGGLIVLAAIAAAGHLAAGLIAAVDFGWSGGDEPGRAGHHTRR
jgi:hypothetical protein